MSLGKLSDVGDMGELGKGLTLAEFKAELEKAFWQAYGRYENASGKLWIEIEHNGDADFNAGSVKWRKGEVGNPELLEDLILERKEALVKFANLMNKGYSIVFRAVTTADFEKNNEKRLAEQSSITREGLLGTYYRGQSFFRLSEFGDVYSAERGYDGVIMSAKHELDEAAARLELNAALEDGFRRKGEEIEESFDPFAAWRK
jgi:hypothetical protein